MEGGANMTHKDKLYWMALFAKKHNVTLVLHGTCGLARKCVGILDGDIYPDYEWYDEETDERIDRNGDVWIPDDAYNKHPCVAVIGRGEHAESQLYEWLKWFDTNGFAIERGNVTRDKPFDSIEIMLCKNRYSRMVLAGFSGA